MRMQPHPARKPRPVVFTFICNACGKVAHRRTPALPPEWTVVETHDDIYAYCPDDAHLAEGAVQ